MTSRPVMPDARIPGTLRRAATLVGAAVLLVVAASRCVVRVGVAQVGVRVALAGDARGVDDTPSVTGWVLYNPLTERIVIFPTSVHTTVWTKNVRAQSLTDESLSFSSREGVSLDADVALSFHIAPERAPHLYRRFRQNDLETLADSYIRNVVREAFNLAAAERSAADILGTGQPELLADVRRRLQAKLDGDGISVDQLGLAGAPRVPGSVAQAIHDAMEGSLRAVEAENKVRQARAEAEQAVVVAEGQAAAARATARGEADARLSRARAEARANALLGRSASASLLQYRAIQRWSGALPVTHGSAARAPALDVTGLLARGAAEEDR